MIIQACQDLICDQNNKLVINKLTIEWSMMTNNFYIVDVFSESAYNGNPLAVVLCYDELTVETMQKIAAETNYSETTFVMPVPESNDGYRVRLFTPAREIDFAGHPILGTAWVIRHYIEPDTTGPVILNLTIGQVPVTFELSEECEIAWFKAPKIMLGPTCDKEPIAAALGILPQDIDTESPIQQVSAGTSVMIVPLNSLDALQRCKLDLDKYAPLSDQGFPPLIYLVCSETHHTRNDLCVRFFFEAHGVREDPATGNGAAFLGAYILEHSLFTDCDLLLRIEQGHEMNRPSLVMLRTRVVDGMPEIKVGGNIVPVVQGILL